MGDDLLTSTASRRPPTGLDVGARKAILRVLRAGGISPDQMVVLFFHREAFGDVDDYLAALRAEYGEHAVAAIRQEIAALKAAYLDESRLDFQDAEWDAMNIARPEGLILGMPRPDFLRAVEASVGSMTPHRQAAAPADISAICQKRGIPLRLGGVGQFCKFEWTGDGVTEEQVLKPALSALDDPRFALGAGKEFADARRGLVEGGRAGNKRAVADAANAVESALKTLLQEHGSELPATQNLVSLVKACIDAGLLPVVGDGSAPVRALLEAPGQFANRRGRHGGGLEAHEVTDAEAEAAVSSAAVALTLLARLLPARR